MRPLVILILFLLAACSPQPTAATAVANTPEPTSLPSAMAEAQAVLVNFLTLLHEKKYGEAVPLYGGEYEALQVFNPEIAPDDHLSLWTWACDNRLLQCLEVRSATFKAIWHAMAVFPMPGRAPKMALSPL